MNAVTGGVLAAVLSFIVGVVGCIISLRRDRVVEQTGIATGRSEEVNLIIAGQNHLIENLQDDIRSLREEAKSAAQRLMACAIESEARAKSLRRLYRRYGENGDNGS